MEAPENAYRKFQEAMDEDCKNEDDFQGFGQHHQVPHFIFVLKQILINEKFDVGRS